MYQPLTEGNSQTVNTVLDIASGVAKVAVGKKKSGEYSYSSIASAASKMVAVFPVLASRTISADTAHMVSKYIEQKACTLFMLALQQANISTASNGIEYLQQFHQNLDIGGDNINAIISTMQSWLDAYKESAEGEEEPYLDWMLESDNDLKISSQDMKQLLDIMKENANIKFYDTKLNPISINDYVVREAADGDYHVSLVSSKVYMESDNGGIAQEYLDQARKDYEKTKGNADKTNPAVPDPEEEEEIRKIAKRLQDDAIAQEKRANAAGAVIAAKRGRTVTAFKDQDIKKMNDAVPSLLVVKFWSSDTASVATEFVIGVKSKLIPVTTDEVLRRIMNDNKDGKKFNQFMRVITGELKATEVIFGLSRIKDDVLSTKKKGAYGNVWNLLANRAEAARTAVKHGQHNDFSAITTLVISQADADELYREENFDITNPKNAMHFMRSYNLMGFIIADDALGILRVMMDDGEKTFSEYAYRMLERETQDGTYKKLINLMAASK